MPNKHTPSKHKTAAKKPAPSASRAVTEISGRGGYRPNAGRPPGKGESVSSLKNEVLHYRRRYKRMPLEHLMNALNDECSPKRNKETEAEFFARQAKWRGRQDWAAVQAAPFMHAKLASVEIVTGGQPVQHPVDLKKLTPEELDTMEALVRKASINPEDMRAIELDESQYHEVDHEVSND